VSRLEQFQNLSREEFLGNQDTLDLTCYRLLVAMEAALAICYHVSAKQLQKVPEEYAECFGTLEKAGILSSNLATSLKKMARFRNLLVHMYWKIDYNQVYKILTHDVQDLRTFGQTISSLL
jgi:uncharacterized protein YutE (UPF0331/DUF86 family)